MAAGILHVRDELLPLITSLPGCVGLSMMVEWDAGLAIVTSAWQTEQAMRQSADAIHAVRWRAIESLDASGPTVKEWQIALVHRAHRAVAGACARASWLRTDPGRVDELVDAYRTRTLPGLEPAPGFCSASLLVDRASGDAVATHCYDDLAALTASRPPAARPELDGTQEIAETLEVREFNLVLAHLHVPEAV
jgi:hypothetical protein